jgi:dGTPase
VLYERFWEKQPPDPRGVRSATTKDRDRLIHSSALRRLQGKTQIFGVQMTDFFRTRLTHSLECAQIGRAIARRVQGAHWEGVTERPDDFADVVEAACLAHDVGHPPFGHNGEEALREKMREHNGSLFEGNAQSFRIVTYVEPKDFGLTRNGTDRWVGLNLTRTTLRALMKYPWSEADRGLVNANQGKFGAYEDELDREYFDWVWNGAAPEKTVAAQIMDAADDIAYATHDFEDGVWSEMIPLHLLLREDPLAVATLERKVLAFDRKRTTERAFPDESIEEPLSILLSPLRNAEWAGRPFDRSKFSRRFLKRFVTDLIHYFIHEVSTGRRFTRPASEVRQRLDLLTGMARVWMIDRSDLATQQYGQRRLVADIFEGYWKEPAMIPRRDEWDEVRNTTRPPLRLRRGGRRWPEKARLICDHIAGMTDAYAREVHNQMFQAKQEVVLRWTY